VNSRREEVRHGGAVESGGILARLGPELSEPGAVDAERGFCAAAYLLAKQECLGKL
jgi:hypothetical protein